MMDARGNQSGRLDEDEYRKRLQDKFGDRWRTRQLVVPKNGKGDTEPVTPDEKEEDVTPRPGGNRSSLRKRKRSRKRKPRIRLKKANPGGDHNGQKREIPVDVPRYAFKGAEDFEEPWHLAMWSPRDQDGPTVYINKQSGILQDIIEHHQEQYPEIYQEEVAEIVRSVFGEVASCKVAHAQKLSSEISEEAIDADYRNEKALTIALMGLIAEESLISPRLGRLGRKKPQD